MAKFNSRLVYKVLEVHVVVFLLLTGSALQCGPGRRSGRVRRPKKMTPLVFKQHVPNVSEYTLGASGPAEKRITRDMPEFKDLLTNYNPDIEFKDEEGTGADRIMSQRCKDKLNTLAIAVMNRWPGVKLRVTEAWDEDGIHSRHPLHYEGRAVDISTSDRDRSKNGVLARLAVNAGFDWVFYESKHHIHVSVKSDSSITIKTGGCFSADSLVQLSTGGTLPMSQLAVGDKVLAMSPEGVLEYSDVYMFLDSERTARAQFLTLVTESGHQLSVTPSHMLQVANTVGTSPRHADTVFAARVEVGQYVFLAQRDNATLRQSRVVGVHATSSTGYYAPLTKHGTVVVNDVLTSCYALFDSPTIAHWSLAPMRLYYNTWSYFRRKLGSEDDARQLPVEYGHPVGVHWYARVLHTIGSALLDQQYWF